MSLNFVLDQMSTEERDAAALRAKQAGRNFETSPRIIFLVGAPGSGKSTWRAKYLANNLDRETTVVSSDDMIENYAASLGLNYTQVYSKIDMDSLDKLCMKALQDAVAAGRDVIIDRTNMRDKPRSRFLSQVTKKYTRVAILFCADCDTIRRRLIDRERETGKHIPYKVVQGMLATYQAPTFEKFDLIGVN